MAEMAQDSFFWQISLKQLSTSPKNLNAMGVEECQHSLAFLPCEAPMNRRLYSRTKRTFFMEMENKRRFFLNMGDGSKKTLIPTCYFGKNTE